MSLVKDLCTTMQDHIWQAFLCSEDVDVIWQIICIHGYFNHLESEEPAGNRTHRGIHLEQEVYFSGYLNWHALDNYSYRTGTGTDIS